MSEPKYRFTVKNFQSIGEAQIELGGFLTIVGKSNRGKSAMVRALRALFYNDWSQDFIKSGEKETDLFFEFLDPNSKIRSIRLTKGKQKNEYRIVLATGEEKVYPKVAKGVPDLFAELKIEEIESEKEDKFNLNFQGQFDPVFLLGQSEVLVSSFINRIFDISRIERALRAIKSDEIDLSSKEKQWQARDLTLADSETSWRGRSTEIDKAIAKLNIAIQEVDKSEAYLHEIESGLSAWGEINYFFEHLNDWKKDLNDATLVVKCLESLKSGLGQIVELSREGLSLQEKQDSLQRLSSEFRVTSSCGGVFEKISTSLESYVGLHREYTYLKNSEVELSTMSEQQQTSEAYVEYLEEAKSLMSALIEVGEFENSMNLLGVMKQEHLQTDQTLYIVEKVRELIFEEIGACPLCGKLDSHEHEA